MSWTVKTTCFEALYEVSLGGSGVSIGGFRILRVIQIFLSSKKTWCVCVCNYVKFPGRVYSVCPAKPACDLATNITHTFQKQRSKVVSTHLWNTPLNLYQQAIKGILSTFTNRLCDGLGCAPGVCCNLPGKEDLATNTFLAFVFALLS